MWTETVDSRDSGDNRSNSLSFPQEAHIPFHRFFYRTAVLFPLIPIRHRAYYNCFYKIYITFYPSQFSTSCKIEGERVDKNIRAVLFWQKVRSKI